MKYGEYGQQWQIETTTTTTIVTVAAKTTIQQYNEVPLQSAGHTTNFTLPHAEQRSISQVMRHNLWPFSRPISATRVRQSESRRETNKAIGSTLRLPMNSGIPAKNVICRLSVSACPLYAPSSKLASLSIALTWLASIRIRIRI